MKLRRAIKNALFPEIPSLQYLKPEEKVNVIEYENVNLLATILKTNRFKEYYTQVSERGFTEDHERLVSQYCFLKAKKDNLKVLDFGGALGFVYYLAQRALPETRFDYTIVETDFFVEKGKEHNQFVKFAKEIPKEHFDFVEINSTLQYFEDWKDLINKLSDTDWLHIGRTMSTVGESFKVKHYIKNNDGYLLFSVIDKYELINYVKSLGFELVDEFVTSRMLDVKDAPTEVFYSDLLFKKII